MNDLPQFDDCVIAYIDLMGIKERIKSQYTLNTIWLFIKDIVDLCATNERLYCRAFSDNIVICEKVNKEEPLIAICDVMNIVKEIEFFMFHIEFPFVRGAVVCGQIYYDNDYIIGEALLKAYRIEQENAVFPRIIIDMSINELCGRKEIDLVIKDRDDLYFYDYMAAIIECGKRNLLQSIRTLKANILWNIQTNYDCPKIVSKMEWLVNYFNESCEHYNINCKISMKELHNTGIFCEPLRLIARKPNKDKKVRL